jgi:lipid-A-disaccharide synthase
MAAAGVDVRIGTSQFGYVGLQESFRFRTRVRKVRKEIEMLLRRDRPDLVVLVDGDRLDDWLVHFLDREGIPFVLYFVPQVWFWGRWRVRGLARRARMVIPAFAAEVKIFEQNRARVEWLGHPLADIVRAEADSDRILVEMGLNPRHPIIGLMPGSRFAEIERFTPILLEAAGRLGSRHPHLQFVMPLAAAHLRASLTRQIAEAGLGGRIRMIEEHVYTCLSRCQAVLLSSGTATLETALLGVPMVVFYSVHPVTYLAARLLVNTSFIAMPNILLGQAVAPELIQGDFTVDRLVAEASSLLENGERAAAMRARLREIRALLGGGGVLAAAARLILAECRRDAAPRREFTVV